VFTGGCDSGAGIGSGSLVALVTVAVSVFLPTECLDASGVEALAECFEQDRLNILFGDELGEGGQRYRFVFVDANRESHVEFSVHGLPRGLDTRGDPFRKGISCY